jgi:hypothetical protein
VKPYEACWDVLVQHAGADPDPQAKKDFLRHVRENPDFTEYRFCGHLGFGGKFWDYLNQLYVSCYPEDATPERVTLIAKVNELLSDLSHS